MSSRSQSQSQSPSKTLRGGRKSKLVSEGTNYVDWRVGSSNWKGGWNYYVNTPEKSKLTTEFEVPMKMDQNGCRSPRERGRYPSAKEAKDAWLCNAKRILVERNSTLEVEFKI